jgi:DNA invertase Pin-like site-specific DNA recombinase
MLTPGTRVVLVARVSTERQRDNGNLDDEVTKLLRWAKKVGVEVVPVDGEKVYAYVASSMHGWRPCLAAKAARQAGAVIVTTTMDRYRRPQDFCSWADFYAPLTDHDMRELLRYADGVPLYTIADPDAPPTDNRSEQPKRGMEAKGHYGGRGRKVTTLKRHQEYRERHLAEAVRLKAEGLSLTEIGKRLGVRKGTICKWLKRAESGSETLPVSADDTVTAEAGSETASEGVHAPTHDEARTAENAVKTPSPRAVPASASTPSDSVSEPASAVTLSQPSDDPHYHPRTTLWGRGVATDDDVPRRPTRGQTNGRK